MGKLEERNQKERIIIADIMKRLTRHESKATTLLKSIIDEDMTGRKAQLWQRYNHHENTIKERLKELAILHKVYAYKEERESVRQQIIESMLSSVNSLFPICDELRKEDHKLVQLTQVGGLN
jgi:hypothetical protein